MFLIGHSKCSVYADAPEAEPEEGGGEPTQPSSAEAQPYHVEEPDASEMSEDALPQPKAGKRTQSGVSSARRCRCMKPKTACSSTLPRSVHLITFAWKCYYS